jgi:hypothetical protein
MAEATAKMAEVASMLVDSRFFCVKLGKRVKKKVRKTNNAILPTNSANQKLGVYRLCNLATLRLEISPSFVLLDKVVLSPDLNKILIFASLFQHDGVLTCEKKKM